MADTVEKNKDYFGHMAKEYDAKHGKTIDELINHIRSMKTFISSKWVGEDEDTSTSKKEVRLLDYACGTGTVSRALAPWVTSTVGIDITEKMVEMYNTGADNQGLSESEMHGYVGNLCDAEDPSPAAFTDAKFRDFDVAGVGMGFHHFADPEFAAKQLASRLRTGGTLFIIDFLPHDEPTHPHKGNHTITQNGFGEEQMRKIFESAGCGEGFGLREMGNGVVFENMHGAEGKKLTRHVFLARGTKVA